MAKEGTAAVGVMDVNTALGEILTTSHPPGAHGIREAAKASNTKPFCVCLHPTVMSLYMSSWWSPFVLNIEST